MAQNDPDDKQKGEKDTPQIPKERCETPDTAWGIDEDNFGDSLPFIPN